MILNKNLESKLKEINNIIDYSKLLSVKGTERYIKSYYKANQLPYYYFQNSDGFFHFGVTKLGKGKKDDVLFQPKMVLGYVKKYKAKNILELGMGRGSNSAYLAKKVPDANFYGVDFSPAQLRYAKKRAKKLPNFFPRFGNYQNLKRLPKNYFDIIYAVETFCYSTRKEKDFRGFSDLLKKGGRLVIFDGYRTKGTKAMKKSQLLAVKLAEKGMAFEKLDTYKDTKKAAAKAGLRLESEENLSKCVMANLIKLEKLSGKFFHHPNIARFLYKMFPKVFVFNAVSAYLMPILVKMNCFCYMQSVFVKPKK